MGAQKQTLDLAGKPMLEYAATVFSQSSLDEVVVVLNPSVTWSPRRRRRMRVVLNERPEAGISSSVKTGVDALDDRSEAVVIGLADKPFLQTSTIESLIKTYRLTRAEIVVPVRSAKRGNPILFRRDLFPCLRSLKGDVGAKVLVESKKYQVIEVPVDDVGVLIDVDTQEDLRRARGMFSRRAALAKGKAGK